MIIKFFKLIVLIILCLMAFTIYDFFIGSQNLKVKEYQLETESIEGLKVVNFADVHYGFEITDVELNELVDRINAEEADLVLFTGDLLDNYSLIHEMDQGVTPLIEAFNRIDAKLGKFAVYGNHDYYCNTYLSQDTFRYIMEHSGFQVLRNNMATVEYEGASLDIIGLDNYGYGNPDFIASTGGMDMGDYQIVLVHEPDYIKLMDEHDFDLYLAGHSHGGQIWIPFYGPLYTTNAANTYVKGLYEHQDKSIIVMTGVGETKVKYRLFNPPSFDVIDLEVKND